MLFGSCSKFGSPPLALASARLMALVVWLLDGNFILKRNYAVYSYVYIHVVVHEVCRGPRHMHMLHCS